jgi:hypothetical protein
MRRPPMLREAGRLSNRSAAAPVPGNELVALVFLVAPVKVVALTRLVAQLSSYRPSPHP